MPAYATYTAADFPDDSSFIKWAKGDATAAWEAQLGTDPAYAVKRYVQQATGHRSRYLVRFNLAPYLANVQAPILALNSYYDLLVDYRDLTRVTTALRQARNKHVTTLVLSNLNHLLQPCYTCFSTKYGDLKFAVLCNVVAQLTRYARQPLARRPITRSTAAPG